MARNFGSFKTQQQIDAETQEEIAAGERQYERAVLREGEPDLTGYPPDSNLTPRQWWDDR